MSIINGRSLTKVFDDPDDLEPLTPNHLLLLRQNESLPPGLFEKNDTTLIPGEDGDKYSIWQMCSGVAGKENTFLCCRSARNGLVQGETSLLETPLLLLMNKRPGIYGRSAESRKFSQIRLALYAA